MTTRITATAAIALALAITATGTAQAAPNPHATTHASTHAKFKRPAPWHHFNGPLPADWPSWAR